jgi:thymidylate kinase
MRKTSIFRTVGSVSHRHQLETECLVNYSFSKAQTVPERRHSAFVLSNGSHHEDSVHATSVFRGKGSLGELVYNLHHFPGKYGLHGVDPTARQLLHVAAHIDALHKTIIPALECGEIVVMDRFWWSTVVYGKAAGIDSDSLRLMIELELCHWLHYRPTAVFLLERSKPARIEHSPGIHDLLGKAYADLEEAYKRDYPIYRISTSGGVEESFDEILSRVI